MKKNKVDSFNRIAINEIPVLNDVNFTDEISKEQFVIVTTPVREKQYVVHGSTLDTTKKHLVSYSLNKSDAEVFDSFKEAETYKDNINNPYNRLFSIELL